MSSHLNKGYHEARELILADFERAYLEHAVKQANGNISNAARHAGVDRTTLYRLMEKHGNPPRQPTPGAGLMRADVPNLGPVDERQSSDPFCRSVLPRSPDGAPECVCRVGSPMGPYVQERVHDR